MYDEIGIPLETLSCHMEGMGGVLNEPRPLFPNMIDNHLLITV